MYDKAQKQWRLSLLRKPSVEALRTYLKHFPDDSGLEEHTKQIYRSRLLRNPNPEGLTEYYTYWKEKDIELEKALETRLYTKFNTEPNREKAIEYLEYFPTGINSTSIRKWLVASEAETANEIR